MKPVATVFAAVIVAAPIVGSAQAFSNNPWARSAWGSSVRTFLSTSSSFNVPPYRSRDGKNDAAGGGFELDAGLNSAWPGPAFPDAKAGGRADNRRYKLKADAWHRGMWQWRNANGTEGTTNYSATSVVEVWDTIELHQSNNPANFVPLSLKVHGASTSGGTATVRYLFTEWSNAISGSQWNARTMTGHNGWAEVSDKLFLSPLSGWQTYVIGLQLRVEAPSGTIPNAAVYSNFGNTIHFQMNLPNGMQYRSASGVFEPQSIQAVPEPGTLAALAVGAGVLIRRRRR